MESETLSPGDASILGHFTSFTTTLIVWNFISGVAQVYEPVSFTLAW